MSISITLMLELFQLSTNNLMKEGAFRQLKSFICLLLFFVIMYLAGL